MNDKHTRLRDARIAAGFVDGADAARALEIPTATYNAHENGHRGYKVETAQRYARRFHTTAEWLLFGTGEKRNQQPATTPTGFSEEAATPIDATAYKALQSKYKDETHIAHFELKGPIHGVFPTETAIALIDLKTPPIDGDLVIATIDDLDAGTSKTIVRRLIGKHLVTLDLSPHTPIDETITVRGKIARLILEF